MRESIDSKIGDKVTYLRYTGNESKQLEKPRVREAPWTIHVNRPAGAYEGSAISAPVADSEQPLELLRTIHSFDPCMACAVHVLEPGGRGVTRTRVA